MALLTTLVLLMSVTGWTLIHSQGPECTAPPDTGPCDGPCVRWYYDPRHKECRQFSYGCCEGNENNYETAVDCYASCGGPGMCNQPEDPGPCEGLCARWFYHVQSGQCRQFQYGCCEGNDNKFPDETTCQTMCGLTYVTGEPKMSVCNLPPAVGECDGHCERWYYNSTQNRCLQFVWGCCGGNGNRFETEEECMDNCGRLE